MADVIDEFPISFLSPEQYQHDFWETVEVLQTTRDLHPEYAQALVADLNQGSMHSRLRFKDDPRKVLITSRKRWRVTGSLGEGLEFFYVKEPIGESRQPVEYLKAKVQHMLKRAFNALGWQ